MTSQTQGIHQLFQAEKQAKDKLEEAKRKTRTASGQAKEEAMVETDQYRMQRDKEFRLKQSKIMGSQSNLSDEIEEQTLGKIQELNGHYNKCMEKIHVNYRAIK
uniref:V-type proton ATPase subunit G n=1 Tax=Saimiri boliviensis boliviensis TaxID=39432 RepID=A0A2K6TXA5_SAIBB